MGGGLWVAGSGILVKVAGSESLAASGVRAFPWGRTAPGGAGSALVAFERPLGAKRSFAVWGRPCAVMPLEPDARSVRDGGSS